MARLDLKFSVRQDPPEEGEGDAIIDGGNDKLGLEPAKPGSILPTLLPTKKSIQSIYEVQQINECVDALRLHRMSSLLDCATELSVCLYDALQCHGAIWRAVTRPRMLS
jgi:hypothetical protein